MRYGYYLAHNDELVNDGDLAAYCRQQWWFKPTPTPQRFEGVSAWFDDKGVFYCRRITRNFFTGKYEVRDLE